MWQLNTTIRDMRESNPRQDQTPPIVLQDWRADKSMVIYLTTIVLHCSFSALEKIAFCNHGFD